MASFLENINKLGACDFSAEKLTSLECHKPYKIKDIYGLETTYGRRIVAVLEGVEGVVYLPERFKLLADTDVEQMKKNNKLHLIYKGKKELTKGRTANEVEFAEL